MNYSVEYSDYLLSRRFNERLYERLKDNLLEIVDEHRNDFEYLHLTIGMSAKYQTPYIKVEASHDRSGNVESAIINAIEEVGFYYTESEDFDANLGYKIHFND